MSDPYDHLFKLLLVGDEAVGKSSILLRFTDNTFNEKQPSTIGVDFKVKMMDVNGLALKISLWDTAGQERFRTLTSSYYRGAQGIVLTYDVTRRETFDHLGQWLEEVDKYTPGGRRDVILVLCGNKVDLEEERKVSKREGEAWARERGMLFIECSAKTKLGIQQVFDEMVLKILDSPSLLDNTVSPANRKEAVADLTQEEPTSDSCC
mmetsp:Transcript_547/g.1023  ORF Transcript_547/g.1023 Transcript_547/m.1023 type:complete len:207 (-) Transcript_547:299-919(-)|eukprot:CAMPEP_0184524604 /NCGR_PEP_ID=MMETSP0198_2-20121128/9616_1 /TAXON_ID=1112570 /ORGANISM="Thraustochytrium sp., Strain LLF1b" /LENGTH=206 /DNA_ID=CAMNT_0026915933 /DNA_START=185 /DNA_END=805 /DNA_ORIENTATION=+